MVPPEIAEANVIEDKLKSAANNGAYLAISVPPGRESEARIELERRFPVEVCDLDAAFITTMRQQAAAAGADWNVVIRADAAAQDSADWKNLQMLVERCLPDISGQLRSPDRTKRLVHPGLLARYDRIEVLANLAADIGRSDKVRGRGADRTNRDPQGGEEKRRGQRRAVTGAPTFCRLSAWGHSVPSSPSKALAAQHVRLPPARRMHPLHFGVDS